MTDVKMSYARPSNYVLRYIFTGQFNRKYGQWIHLKVVRKTRIFEEIAVRCHLSFARYDAYTANRVHAGRLSVQFKQNAATAAELTDGNRLHSYTCARKSKSY